MSAVVFDPSAFKVAYPEFAGVADGFLQGAFNQSGLYLSNSDSSPVQDLTERQTLLWMLVAHIAYLRGVLNPSGTSGGPKPVGRISSGTEGSVSVSLEYGTPGTAAWFSQSQYGAAFWQATLYLRSFRYMPRATRY